MAGIDDIVTVSISAASRNPTQQGFGTPLLMAFHGNFPEKYRVYEDLTGMVSDGFVPYEAGYLMAEAAFSQNPRPERIVMGRLPAAHTHTQEITITSAVEGEHVKLSVMDPGSGTVTNIDYTILPAATTTTVATAVELLIEAVPGVNASSAVAVITVVPANVGQMVYIRDLQNCTIKDVTADAAYDTELTALQAVYDDWYFVALDVNSEANVDKVAAWAETKNKIFVAQTQDYGEKAGTGTLGSGLEGFAYERTGTIFVEAIEEYAACALIGKIAPLDPGSATWKFKKLAGVTPSMLTPTQETNLRNVKLNYYSTIAGQSITQEGYSASGEFLDVRHGTDWLTARLQERVYGVLINANKIPYTDASVDMIVGEVLSVLEQAVQNNFLAAGTLSASGPKVADVDPVDKAARLLPDVKFGATLAGAVHKVAIVGTLSV